jgi:hypothetical protein
MLNQLCTIDLPLDTGDFRLMDRQVVDVLKSVREENRYLRGLVAWVGFDQVAVPYERDARYAGTSKYTTARMLRLAVNGVTSFSERPLLVALYVGGAVTLSTLVLGCWIVVGKLVDPAGAVPGYASVMTAVLFVGGIQLLTIGILGGYVGRTYQESKRRPLYVVSDRFRAYGDGVSSPRQPAEEARPRLADSVRGRA